MRLLHFCTTALLLATVLAHADTLAQVTAGTGTYPSGLYIAEAFQVVGSGTYSNISFSFYTPSQTAFAFGTGYLYNTFSPQTPSQLGQPSPSLVGSAVATGDSFNFGSSMQLQAGDTYYFFDSTPSPANELGVGSFYSGGAEYGSYGLNSMYLYGFEAFDFDVTGSTNAVTPEPSSLALFSTGLLGMAGVLRRRLA